MNDQLIHRDALTGLADRAQLDRFLSEQFAAATREGKPLSLLLLDVDKFKNVNDQHGQSDGDKVLETLGALLCRAARPQDLAARFGGGEMVLVLPGVARASAAAAAEAIRRAVAGNPVRCGTNALRVSVSIGVASFEPGTPFTDPAELLKAAGLAVYAAKRSGRNCVRVFALSKPAATTPA